MIEVFADVCCPFTHAGLRLLVARRGAASARLPLRLLAWPLELVNGAPLDPDLVAEEIEALRHGAVPDAFAGFDRSRFPATSLPALALAAAAYERGVETGERVSLALRHALFEEGRDVADPEVVAAVAADHGLGAPESRHHHAVRADWQEGRRRGVVGSPHFFAAGSSWFCPVLDIRREDGRMHVATDEGALDALMAAAAGG
jgi:predicted DsbA family dithiol-disulfide isomerase